jgi:hypothetical protein
MGVNDFPEAPELEPRRWTENSRLTDRKSIAGFAIIGEIRRVTYVPY